MTWTIDIRVCGDPEENEYGRSYREAVATLKVTCEPLTAMTVYEEALQKLTRATIERPEPEDERG